MRRIAAFLLVFLAVSGYSAQVKVPSMAYRESTPTETVVDVTSTTYVTSAAFTNDVGIKREFQNTGGVNVMYFYVLSSSVTAGQHYLTSGSKYTESDYMGNIYWMCPAGSTSTTLSINYFSVKQ